MKFFLLPYFLLILLACKTSTKNLDITKETSHIMESSHSPTLEGAHPDAKKLMTDSFFFNVIEETAPFGSDDGSGTYASFHIWRKDHPFESLTTFLEYHLNDWGYPKFDINETDFEKLKTYLKQDEMNIRYMTGIDQAIVATAFGQLYLEGKIDNDIKELAVISINRELLPGILRLWRDYENTRKENLNKLLVVLKQIK